MSYLPKSRVAVYIALFSALLVGAFVTGSYAVWQEIEIEGGGVIPDICLLERSNPYPDQLWIAAMNGGVFRNEISGSAWGNWTGFNALADRSCLAVDAVETGVSADNVYVLAAGTYFKRSTDNGLNWGTPTYHPPNGWSPTSRITGVAWHYEGGNYNSNEFYVVRYCSAGEDDGVYRWDNGSQNFQAVHSPGDNVGYNRMYRDISNADIIYITRNAGANTDLYKLSGAYTASLVDMNIASGSNLISIDNISQWDANNMYVAAIEVVGDVKRGIIFHGDPTSGEGFEAIYETDELEDWTNIYDGEYGFYAVGKFEAGTPPVHYLWVADGYHGMQYIEKIEGSPPVVTNIPAGLNAYVPRDMERDRILSSGSTVKILLGTWMGGLWELGFDINDSLKIYDLSKRRDLK